jgi:hypothetical protein
MNCGKCGRQNADDEVVCVDCGSSLQRIIDSCSLEKPVEMPGDTASVLVRHFDTEVEAMLDQPHIEPASENPVETKRLNGVDGWLFWICATGLFLGPVIEIRSWDNPESVPFALFIAISVFGMYVGVSIFRRSNRAIRNVRIYLSAVLALAIGLITLSVVRQADPYSPNDLIYSGYLVAIVVLVKLAIWTLYFQRSRQVKQTLGRNLFDRRHVA